MLLTNVCCKNLESVKCVCNSSTESDRQEPTWDSNLINPSLSSDSVYYEESQFSHRINEQPTKPCQNVQKSCGTPVVEIYEESTTSVDLPPISWHGYNCIPKFLSVNNMGRNILINGQWSGGKPYIEGGPLNGTYMFSQIHFHCPSEHKIDGKRYPLEMHVVHFKTSYLTQERAMEEKDGTVVLVYLFQVKDTCDTVLSCFTKPSLHIKTMNKESEIFGVALSRIVKPFYSHYYIYWGSVSTEKNSYLLQWIINCSDLYATQQEVNDLFNLLGSDESYEGRRMHLMKPVNNVVYYAVGYTKALADSNEIATSCNDCYSNQVSSMYQSCQTITTLQGGKEKKKDVQLQVSSSDAFSIKSHECIKICSPKSEANSCCEETKINDCFSSSLICVHEEEKIKKKKGKKCRKLQKDSNSCTKVSLIDSESKPSTCENKKKRAFLKISTKPTATSDVKNSKCEGQKKQKSNINSSKSEKSSSKACTKEKEKKKKLDTETTSKSGGKKVKKKKSNNTEDCDSTSEDKKKKVASKEKLTFESKAFAQSNRKRAKGNKVSVEWIPLSEAKYKSKVNISECDQNVKTIVEEKENCCKIRSPSLDRTVNFLLTPNPLQSIPSFTLMSSRSEEIKKVSDFRDVNSCNFKASGKDFRNFSSVYELPQPKKKEPLTEFFLQTEHLFRTEKKDFSACISQDYNVSIIYNQNILQEFKGTFYPNKLELGNYKKLDLIPKYPEPDNVIVRLEDCSVKMETLDQLYIRAKFLLKQFIAPGKENELLEVTKTESQRPVKSELNMKLSEIQKEDNISNEKCDQLMDLSKFEKPSSSTDEKQEESRDELISESEESKKQDCEVELLKGPPNEMNTCKTNILDCTDGPCETNVEKQNSQKNLTEKSDKTVKSVFSKRKKTIYFTYEKVEKDENSGKKVFVGKFRTKNEMKPLSKEKKLTENNESCSSSEKTIETKQENSFPLSNNKELVLERRINCERPVEEQELRNQSIPKSFNSLIPISERRRQNK